MSGGSAGVAAGLLRAHVARMQAELGSAEVQIERLIGKGGGGSVFLAAWRGEWRRTVDVTITGHVTRNVPELE